MRESDGEVALSIGVLDGTIINDTIVEIRLYTIDGSANGGR